MEEITISGGDGQSHSDYNGTTNLLNTLNIPTLPRSTVMEMADNCVPRAVSQGRCSLRSGLEVPCINGAGEICQSFGGRAKG